MNINYVTISICIKISILTFPCYQNLHIFQYLLSISMINYISDVEITQGSIPKASCHIFTIITILLTTIRKKKPSGLFISLLNFLSLGKENFYNSVYPYVTISRRFMKEKNHKIIKDRCREKEREIERERERDHGFTSLEHMNF